MQRSAEMRRNPVRRGTIQGPDGITSPAMDLARTDARALELNTSAYPRPSISSQLPQGIELEISRQTEQRIAFSWQQVSYHCEQTFKAIRTTQSKPATQRTLSNGAPPPDEHLSHVLRLPPSRPPRLAPRPSATTQPRLAPNDPLAKVLNGAPRLPQSSLLFYS